MCCSPNRFAVRAATHYHTRAWQTLIYGKECFILLLSHDVTSGNDIMPCTNGLQILVMLCNDIHNNVHIYDKILTFFMHKRDLKVVLGPYEK